MRPDIAVATSIFAAFGMAVLETAAQTAPLEQVTVPAAVDSGFVVNLSGKPGSIFQETIQVPDATWVRLTFDEVILGAAPPGAPETYLRITSLADGAVQTLNAPALQQWSFTSAYFNGSSVSLEVVADADAEWSRVVLSSVLAGPPNEGGVATICGPTDDRVPSDDPRACRTVPGGCTAWLISELASCFLTAGHCFTPGLDVVEFNVPLSASNGQLQHPGPEDQYPVDADSIQLVNGGVGNDWCYFGAFRNSETLLSAFEAQGDAYVLADTAPPVAGQSIRITGYGVDTSPPEWNQIQQTHVGPYIDLAGTTVQYQTDTTGGNSGSPVVDTSTGLAIGIHTNGGCTSSGDANKGTSIGNANLQSARANPTGVCIPELPLWFSFPAGIPAELSPAGDAIRVVVSGQNGGTPQTGTGQLHLNAGGGYVTLPMAEVAPNEYDAVFPALACGTIVSFYFSAETTTGLAIKNPLLAPDAHYSAAAATGVTVAFTDDFESAQDWTITNSGGFTDGQWERGVPVANAVCDRGNPGADADGSGQCFLTDNDQLNCNSDIDNGSTTLTSPIMDANNGTAVITYWRWFSTTAGPNPFQDVFVVEVSANGGASWTVLETVGPTGPQAAGGWFEVSIAIADFVPLTDQFRIRFTAEDSSPASVVEAAVDGVRLTNVECGEAPVGDLDGDALVGVNDLLILLGVWGPCPGACPPSCAADLNADCNVDVMDLLIVLANWSL